ncbi:MAG: hypothetical protein WCQ64_00130 [Acidobacteriota bacterium]
MPVAGGVEAQRAVAVGEAVHRPLPARQIFEQQHVVRRSTGQKRARLVRCRGQEAVARAVAAVGLDEDRVARDLVQGRVTLRHGHEAAKRVVHGALRCADGGGARIAANHRAPDLARQVLQRFGDGVHRRINGVDPVVADGRDDSFLEISRVVERQPAEVFLEDEAAVIVDAGTADQIEMAREAHRTVDFQPDLRTAGEYENALRHLGLTRRGWMDGAPGAPGS